MENGVGGRASTPPKGLQRTVTCKTVGPGSPDLTPQRKPCDSICVCRGSMERKPITNVWAQQGRGWLFVPGPDPAWQTLTRTEHAPCPQINNRLWTTLRHRSVTHNTENVETTFISSNSDQLSKLRQSCPAGGYATV